MADCWKFLERFEAWHAGVLAGRETRTMEEAGFTAAALAESAREALFEKRRLANELRKACKGRLEKHNEVVRLRRGIG